MKIYIGSDHAGYQLKEELKIFLNELGHTVEDFGNIRLEPEDDYPDFIKPVAEAVSRNPHAMGVILGGSGQGEAIAANRYRHVRAAVWYGKNDKILTLSREHNNANVLAIGARFMDVEEAKRGVHLWLDTPYSHDFRHERRIAKIDEL